MATKMMFSALVLLVVVMVMTTEGSPRAPKNTTTTATTPAAPHLPTTNHTQTQCPPVLFVLKDGHCEFVNDKVRDQVSAELRKRQATTACPYCAPGVYDAYPNWSDCTSLNYCLDGRIIPMKCTDMGSRYFNPSLKACELYNNPSNICLHRNIDLRPTS